MSDGNAAARREWIARVLGVTIPDPVSAPGVDRGAELGTRLKGMAEMIRTPAGAAQADAFAAAIEATKAGEFDAAQALLDGVDGVLRSAARAAEAAREIAAATVTTNGQGPVALAKLRLRLNAARGTCQSAVERMVDTGLALLTTEEYEDDPRVGAAAAAIRALPQQVAAMDPGIEDLLDDLISADTPAAREKLRGEIRGAIARYQASLDDFPLLQMLQDTPLGFTPIYDSMTTALADLQSAFA